MTNDWSLKPGMEKVRRLEALDADSFGLPYAAELKDDVLSALKRHVLGLRFPDTCLTAILIVSDRKLAESRLPAAAAEALTGDPAAVFDVAARLQDQPYVNHALWGPPPGFELLPGETLLAFLRRHPMGVVVFDDLQAFDPTAISTIASMCDEGKMQDPRTGKVEPAGRDAIVIATLRTALPSPRELLSMAPGPALDAPAFRRLIERVAEAAHPEHFSPWVRSRFKKHLQDHLWRDYTAATAAGPPACDRPLLPPAPTWAGRAEQAAAAVEDLVTDVAAAIPEETPEPGCDVFVSYRTRRNAELAQWLTRELRGRELGVWLDADSLGVGEEPPERMKARLIRELVTAVRSAHCTIAFAVGQQPWVPVRGVSDEEAVRRGLAMRTAGGYLIRWSWQKLEVDYSRNVLVIDDEYSNFYEVREGRLAGPQTHYRGQEHLLELVLEALRRLEVLR